MCVTGTNRNECSIFSQWKSMLEYIHTDVLKIGWLDSITTVKTDIAQLDNIVAF